MLPIQLHVWYIYQLALMTPVSSLSWNGSRTFTLKACLQRDENARYTSHDGTLTSRNESNFGVVGMPTSDLFGCCGRVLTSTSSHRQGLQCNRSSGYF